MDCFSSKVASSSIIFDLISIFIFFYYHWFVAFSVTFKFILSFLKGNISIQLFFSIENKEVKNRVFRRGEK